MTGESGSHLFLANGPEDRADLNETENWRRVTWLEQTYGRADHQALEDVQTLALLGRHRQKTVDALPFVCVELLRCWPL